MHLVDLAGSERLSKAPLEKKASDIIPDSSQQLLSETKNINLSLTYLEQVLKKLKFQFNFKINIKIILLVVKN